MQNQIPQLAIDPIDSLHLKPRTGHHLDLQRLDPIETHHRQLGQILHQITQSIYFLGNHSSKFTDYLGNDQVAIVPIYWQKFRNSLYLSEETHRIFKEKVSKGRGFGGRGTRRCL